MPPAPSVCVIVPMYNEEAGAERCVCTICPVLSELPVKAALAVVNDGSVDRTASLLASLAGRFDNLMVITHPRNAGYGAALRTGIARAAQAGFTYALFMDSDLTNNPADIPAFVEKMLEGCDVIKATRYSRGGTVSGVPAWRVAISRAGNSIARRLYGLPVADCTNGFRAVKLNVLRRMTLTESRFPIIMEELYYCKYLARSYAEVPVTLTNRREGQRPTSFRYRPRVFYDYLKYPLRSFLRIRPAALAREAR